jgi:hypothetical protein
MTGAAFNRLGPRAREALRRAVDTALVAGRAGRLPVAQVEQHQSYALDLVETAMIHDAAEAQQAGRTDG